jgi:hypothetical protein
VQANQLLSQIRVAASPARHACHEFILKSSEDSLNPPDRHRDCSKHIRNAERHYLGDEVRKAMNESEKIVNPASSNQEQANELTTRPGWMNLFKAPRRQTTQGVATYTALNEPPVGFSRACTFAQPPRPSAGEPTYRALTQRPADYVPGSFFAPAQRQSGEAAPTYKALRMPLEEHDLPLAANY